MRAWQSLFYLAIALAMPALGQNSSPKTFDQFWPETDVYVRLNGSARLFFLWAGTRTEDGGYTDGQAGAHIDLFLPPFFFKDRISQHPDIAKNKFLTVRLGYLFGKTPQGSANQFIEHTPSIESNSRFFVKRLIVTNRNRVDFRFLDGDFTPRYRFRLKIERTIPMKKLALTPYAHAEAFYDWRYHSFHRFRYCAGAELELTGRIVLESYYLRQVDPRSDPRPEHIAGLALQFYLR